MTRVWPSTTIWPVSSSTSSTKPVSCFRPASPAGGEADWYWSPPAACPAVLVAACPVVCPGATANAAPAQPSEPRRMRVVAAGSRRVLVMAFSPRCRLAPTLASRAARDGGAPRAPSALGDVDPVERGLEPLGEPAGLAHAPEVHEEQPRLVVEHVVVDRRDLDPVLPQGAQHRV